METFSFHFVWNVTIIVHYNKKGLKQQSINNNYREIPLLKGVSGRNIIIVNTIYNGFLEEKKTLLKYSFRNCLTVEKDLATVT
jgi:hypothetical protein